METLACSAPEIVLARIGGETSTIRIGSGGIMLPHYAPMKVAESFETLHTLYPGRVDLGIGRAPGGGPLESNALRRTRTGPAVDDFPAQLSELLAFLHHGFPPEHPFSRIRLSPQMPGSPDVWLLGSSLWSGSAAAEFGLPYAFAHFFSPEPTRMAITRYQQEFRINRELEEHTRTQPEAMVAVGVICAETQAEAERLASSVRLLQLRIRQGDRSPVASVDDALRELAGYGSLPEEPGEFPRYFIGTPDVVRAGLTEMANSLGIGELVVNSIIHDHAARLRSYTLLADVFKS